jgi:hypothetical protein
MRPSGSPGVSASGASVRDLVKVAPKTDPVDGEPRPEGDAEREPGGVRVEAKSEAEEGFGLRKGRVASDCESGCASTCWRVLGSLMVDAARGGECIESAAESLSGDCMKLNRRPPRSHVLVCSSTPDLTGQRDCAGGMRF